MMGLTFILSSCFASNAPNLIGKRANYDYSDDISALRDANRGVKIYSSIPERATNIKSIEVKRCHQNFTEDAPTEETLLDDLIIAAYAAGADGISKIKHKREKGLMKNCWHIRSAQGSIFRLP